VARRQFAAEFLRQLADQTNNRRFIWLDHASGQIPIGLVIGIDE
jgi:hypothetical protein